MVDPFFQNTNQQNPLTNLNPNSSQNQSYQNNLTSNTGSISGSDGLVNQNTTNSDPQIQIKQKINQLNNQQQQIQTKYQELKLLYQTNQLDQEQKEQIHDQMQKLSLLYTQNKQTLAMLSTDISGDKQVQINKNVQVKEQKKSKKISFSGIMIGCGLVFLFLIGGLAAIFYYLIQNPNQLSSVGIDSATAVQLLQIFTIIFFGLLFFVSLGMLIVNIYRIITSKNKKKLGYAFGIIIGFIVFIFTLIVGANVLNTLRSIEVGGSLDPNRLLMPYYNQFNPNTSSFDQIPVDNTIALIAPASMSYRLNSPLFIKQVVPTLGNITLQDIKLDCGNGQNLSVNNQNATFIGSCMYRAKGSYELKLNIFYTNNQTSENLSKIIPAGTLQIRSQIQVRTNKGEISYGANELIAGTNPIKITYDAGEVFRDFQLQQYQVLWDADGDGTIDRSDYTIYTHLYTGAQVYYVRVRFPSLNNFIYSFPIRVEQSDVPVAYIEYNIIGDTEYNIVGNFYGIGPEISDYVFNILDKQTNKIIDTINSKTPNIKYTFPGNGIYAVQMIFVTQEGKQGIAESENIEIGGSQFQISYNILAKTPTKPSFEKLEETDNIQITEIPTILRIDINNIIPHSPSTTITVFVDGSPVVSTNNSFQTTLDESKDYSIKIIVSDPNRDIKTEKDLKFSVKRDDIIGKLLVSPDIVGTSPFAVKFDASTTTITDPQDEIVYFSRDFGDGNLKPNLSQSIINHTYIYDFENENGVFYPKVTVKTKKGRELIVGDGTMISVKKPTVTLSINLDSHPAQVASVSEKVDMSLNIDGLPETISRNFGNGNTLDCKGRQCVDASQIYNTPGEYTISVKVTYLDRPTIEGKINVIIR